MILKRTFVIVNILIVCAIVFVEYVFISSGGFIVEETGFIDVLFCPEIDCLNELTALIETSKKTKCAFFDADKNFLDKFIETEILIDENNFEGIGQKIVSEGLMHNKFCIIDDKTVWTGSFNPTANNVNRNNVIVIESETLVKNYIEEFEEIKKGQQEQTKKTEVIFNGYLLQNYFCPEDHCQKRILLELEKAEHSISFLTFTFTDKDIAHELIEKHKQGVKVKGVVENFQSRKYWVVDDLQNAGIQVRVYKSSELQHNKVFIIDEKTVITGSFNPTNAANTINDENILIIREPEIVRKYVDYLKPLLTLDDQKLGKSLSMNPRNESE